MRRDIPNCTNFTFSLIILAVEEIDHQYKMMHTAA